MGEHSRPPHGGEAEPAVGRRPDRRVPGDRRVSDRVGYCHCCVMIRIRPQQFRITPVAFMIEVCYDAAAQQARSGRVSLTPTEANAAKLVAEGPSNPEIAATLLLTWRTVATTSGMCCGSSVHSRMDIVRVAALRATASMWLELRRPARRFRARHLGPGVSAGPGARGKVPRCTRPGLVLTLRVCRPHHCRQPRRV